MKSHFNKNYTCDQCNSKFSRKDYLNAHIKTHFKFRDTNSIPLTKEKFNLSCKICQKTFARKKFLDNHEKQHSRGTSTMEEKLKCNICSNQFARKTNLKNHAQVHAPKPTEKPFSCDVCSRTFTHDRNLKRHISKDHKIQGTDGMIFLSKEPRNPPKTYSKIAISCPHWRQQIFNKAIMQLIANK